MSTKNKILGSQKKESVIQEPVATTKPIKKNTESVAPANVVKNAEKNMREQAAVQTAKADPNAIQVERPTEQEVQKRNVEAFRKSMDDMSGLTEEEKRKRDRARAVQSLFATIGDGLSAIVNLNGAANYAPYVRPTSSLKTLQAKWDKQDKEDSARARENLTLYQQMKAAQRAEDEIKHRNKREEIADKRAEEEVKWRREQAAKTEAARTAAALQAQQNVDREFEYKKENDKANRAQQAAQFKEREARLANQNGGAGGNKNTTDIILTDSETLKMPNSVLKEPANVSSIYKALPEHLKQQAIERYATKDGQPTIDFRTGKEVQKYKPMTAQQMRQAIGDFLSDSDAIDAQNVARRLAGQEVSSGLGWGTKKHTTDDEETDW